MKELFKFLSLLLILLILFILMSASHTVIKKLFGFGILTIISDILFIFLAILVLKKYGYLTKYLTKKKN